MTDKLFNIVFNGEFVKGVNEAAVKTNVGKLFGLAEPQLAVIFSGKRVVLKKKIDSATAIKYRGKLKQAGIVTAIEPVAAEPENTVTPVKSEPIDAPAAVAPEATPNDSSPEESSSQPEANAEDWVIAPVGVQLLEGVEKQAIPQAPDVSHISVAPVGSEILVEKKQVVAVEVDISNLSIAPED
ncbi:MAG: hypothetical protein COB04_03020 [Gammaproteobacteria bacterium]|nr:MAG: hypothetical protein COB04_03020 [Gammaproteobacteria bacterium]